QRDGRLDPERFADARLEQDVAEQNHGHCAYHARGKADRHALRRGQPGLHDIHVSRMPIALSRPVAPRNCRKRYHGRARAACASLTRRRPRRTMHCTPDVGRIQPARRTLRVVWRQGGWRFAVAVIAVVAVLLIARALDAPARLREALFLVRDLGAWGPALFVVLYVAATVLFLPGWILTLGAGAVFGLVRGAVTVSLAATLGATAAFLIGRYLARDAVARRLAAHPRFAAIDAGVAREGWKIVLLTRLSPAFPFNLLNY